MPLADYRDYIDQTEEEIRKVWQHLRDKEAALEAREERLEKLEQQMAGSKKTIVDLLSATLVARLNPKE